MVRDIVMKKKPADKKPVDCDQMVCRTADNIPCYIAYVSAKDLRYRYVNHLFETSFSRPSEEIVGSHVKDIIGQSNYDFALPYIEEVKKGKTVSYINTFGLAEGKRWVKVTYAPDFDEAGEVVGIFVHSFDVSEQLRSTNQQLAEAEERYRTVADFTYDWETWEGQDGDMLYVSPSCERISGYSAQEIMDDPALLRSIILPEDVKVWDAHIDRRREERINVHGPVVEFRIRRKDGSVRWINHQCQPVMSKDGEYRGIRGSNRDVTHHKELMDETSRQQAELAHISRVSALNELTASIAHELNQPLAAILCNAQAAQRFMGANPPNLDEVGGAIADIISDERRADQVIKRLRKLLKRGEAEREMLDLNDLVCEVLAILANEATNSNVIMELIAAKDMPSILGDRIQLEQVILNLVTNAIDALRDSEEDRRVSLSTSHSDSTVTIRVRDRGPGLPTSIEEDIFKPFVTTKEKGLGIGLSLCKTIAESHGGFIEGKNNEGGGACFTLALPIANENQG